MTVWLWIVFLAAVLGLLALRLLPLQFGLLFLAHRSLRDQSLFFLRRNWLAVNHRDDCHLRDGAQLSGHQRQPRGVEGLVERLMTLRNPLGRGCISLAAQHGKA